MTITPTLFVKAGETLFGEEWRQPLADLLGINVRTVRRIGVAAREGAEYPVQPEFGPRLAVHLRERAHQLSEGVKVAEALANQLE